MNRENNADIPERAGKYLTFVLGTEEYGVMIMYVRTIIGMMDITRMPRTPDYVRGVINLRGQIIPIVDMRSKFGMETVEDTRETTIIVVENHRGDQMQETGIVVDAVSEVLDVTAGEIEDAPEFTRDFNSEFILGMAKTRSGVISLLNIQKILGAESKVSIAVEAE